MQGEYDLEKRFNLETLRWAMLMTAIQGVGDSSLKQNAKTGDPAFFALGQASYITQAYTLSFALKDNKLGLLNSYWNAMTNVTNMVIGMAGGENYTTSQFIGIGLITAGILLL
jgi:multidrug transporter EmrE-like cation transporter